MQAILTPGRRRSPFSLSEFFSTGTRLFSPLFFFIAPLNSSEIRGFASFWNNSALSASNSHLILIIIAVLAVGLIECVRLRAVHFVLGRTRRRLADCEERLALVAQATNDVIWDWDLETDRRCWNGFQDLLQASPQESNPHAQRWSERLHPHDRKSVLAAIGASLDCGDGAWSCEYRFLQRDGSYAHILDRGSILRDAMGRPIRMVGSMMDITRRILAEQELQRLTGRVIEAQELERGRVARELHDGVNQLLSAAKFRVRLLEAKLAAADPNLFEHATRAGELLSDAIQEVRAISHNLRPSELDDLGLLPALRGACDEFFERTGIAIELVDEAIPEVLPPEIELTVYRVVQEGLMNVEKHAKASLVHVRLAQENRELGVSIADNGRGWPPHKDSGQSERTGLGLANMKERAAFLGGTVSVANRPGDGVEVVMRLPIGGIAKDPKIL